jgi:hypothetical protein
MYDLATDPDQLQSVEPTADRALIDALAGRLTELHSCQGQQCRDLENLPWSRRAAAADAAPLGSSRRLPPGSEPAPRRGRGQVSNDRPAVETNSGYGWRRMPAWKRDRGP